MQAMAMTVEERMDFHELKKKVDVMEDEIHELTSKIDRILSIVKGIAIGLIVGAVIFGFLKFQDIIDVVK